VSAEPGNPAATGVRAVVEVLAKALADRPESVRVTESQHKQVTLIEVYVSPQDIPKMIGRQGGPRPRCGRWPPPPASWRASR
jgi:hypothetical protein